MKKFQQLRRDCNGADTAAYMVLQDKKATGMDDPMIFGVNSDAIRRIYIAHGDNEVNIEKGNDRTCRCAGNL